MPGLMARCRCAPSAVARAARIHDDDADAFARRPAFDPLPEHRMTFGHVRADNQEAFGLLDVVVTRRRPVAAEGQLVGAGGAGHAQAGIGIHVVRADEPLGQLVENVLRLGGDLAGNVKGDGIRAMGPDDVAKFTGHVGERRIEARRLERPGAVGAELGRGQPVRGGDDFIDLGAFRTDAAQGRRMRLVTLDAR